MTKRGLVLVGVGAVLLVACARPGSARSDPHPGGTAGTASAAAPGVVLPTVGLAACVAVSAVPPVPSLPAGPSVPPAPSVPAAPAVPPGPAVPGPLTGSSLTGGSLDDQFERNNRANNMFRERHAMPPLYAAAAQPCVQRIRTALEALRKQNRYDTGSVAQVLRDVGLTDIIARAPGRLDLGPGDGVVFAGSSGVGCIFGQHAPEASTVDFGSAVADGGCLVAPG